MNKALQLAFIAATSLSLAGCLGSSTYGTGVTQEAQLLKDVTGVLSLGAKDKQPIEYRDRAPLILPDADGAQTLPKPQERVDARPQANWPVDRDQQRSDPEFSGFNDINGKPIKKSEIANYRLPRGQRFVNGAQDPSPFTFDNRSRVTDTNDDTLILDPVERRKVQDTIKQVQAEEAKTAQTQTGRRFLTDPPVEYRQPKDPNYIQNTAENPIVLDGEVTAGKKKRKLWPFGRKKKG